MAQRVSWRSRLASERGADLVEFALVLPLLLVVFGGIVDFGFMFQRYLVVSNAAREGARLASMPNYEVADVEARVNSYLDAGLGAGASSNAVVAVTSGPPASGGAYTVFNVTVTFTEAYFILGPLVTLVGGNAGDFGDVQIQSTASMRAELQGS